MKYLPHSMILSIKSDKEGALLTVNINCNIIYMFHHFQPKVIYFFIHLVKKKQWTPFRLWGYKYEIIRGQRFKRILWAQRQQGAVIRNEAKGGTKSWSQHRWKVTQQVRDIVYTMLFLHVDYLMKFYVKGKKMV